MRRDGIVEVNRGKFTTTALLGLIFLAGGSDPASDIQGLFLGVVAMGVYFVVGNLVVHPFEGAVVRDDSQGLLGELSRAFCHLGGDY